MTCGWLASSDVRVDSGGQQDTRRLLSEARAAPRLMSGRDDQLKSSDIRKFNVIFLDLA
jgi:hypothetical protein